MDDPLAVVTKQLVYKNARLDPEIWEHLKKNNLFVNGPIECGILCLRNQLDCNIFSYNKGEHTCTTGKVSLVIFIFIFVEIWCFDHFPGPDYRKVFLDPEVERISAKNSKL